MKVNVLCDNNNEYYCEENVTASCSPCDSTTYAVSGCTINFGAPTADSYLWDFGDGNTSTTQSPVHKYTAQGTSTVALTMWIGGTSYNCTMSVTPACFDACVTNEIGVTMQSCSTYTFTPPPVTNCNNPTYSWNFGDGNTSTASNPQHTYASSGNYNVTVDILCDNGDEYYCDKDVNVDLQNCASCSSTTYAVSGCTVNFSTPSADSYLWDFGDGNTSTTQNPVHKYIAQGSYTVDLTYWISGTSYNCTMSVTPACFDACVTNEIGVTMQSCSTYTFTPPPVTNCNNPTYSWNFGDGNTSTSSNPQHTYASSGNYNATVYILCDNGDEYYCDKDVIVDFQNCASCSSTTYSISGCTVNFSTPSADSYLWDFGDGNASTIQNPVHKYTAQGSYTVDLTYWIGGISYTCTMSVTPACFDACDTNEIGITMQSCSTYTFTPPPVTNCNNPTYLWDFGDGNTSAEKDPEHEYSTWGDYNVKIVIICADGDEYYCNEELNLTANCFTCECIGTNNLEYDYNCDGTKSLNQEEEELANCSPDGITKIIGYEPAMLTIPVRFHFQNIDPSICANHPNGRQFHKDGSQNHPAPEFFADKIAYDIVRFVNQQCENPPEDSIDLPGKVYDFFFRLELNDLVNDVLVYDYQATNIPNDDEYLNILIIDNPDNCVVGGIAGHPIELYNMHEKENYNKKWDYAWTLKHEIGHNGGLSHSFSCLNDIYDMNKFSQCNNTIDPATSCQPGNGPLSSVFCKNIGNNFMGYNGKHALTPGQLQKMNYTLSRQTYTKTPPCDPGDTRIIESGTTETWDSYQFIPGDIIVATGATLNVRCLIQMRPNTTVHVQKGARLNISGQFNGFALGKLCDGGSNSKWNGIKVYGDPKTLFTTPPDIDNLRPTDPGVVTLGDYTRLIAAKIGIFANTGIIIDQGAVYVDNDIAVEIRNYNYENLTHFSNSKVGQLGHIHGLYGFKFLNSKNIEMEKCSFGILDSYGVYSYNSSISVKNCSFRKIKGTGIYASSTFGNNNTIVIDGLRSTGKAKIQKCGTGIQAIGISDLSISNYIFNSNQKGIDVLGQSGYVISQNEFKCHETDIYLIGTGIRESLITCNDHENSTNSLLISGINTGVQIDQNNIRGKNGIRLNPVRGATELSTQGTDEFPATNEFIGYNQWLSYKLIAPTAPTKVQVPPNPFSTWAYASFFEYTHHDAQPDCLNLDDFIAECELIKPIICFQACNPNIFGTRVVPANNFGNVRGSVHQTDIEDCTPREPRIAQCTDEDCFQNRTTLLLNLRNQINGGDVFLEEKISNYTGDEVDLINQIVASSPYLSTQALLLFVDNENFSIDQKVSVLQANQPIPAPVLSLVAENFPEPAYVAIASDETEESLLNNLNQEITLQNLERNFSKDYFSAQIFENEDYGLAERLFYSSGIEEDKIDLLDIAMQMELWDESHTLINEMLNSTNENVVDFGFIQSIYLNLLENESFEVTQEVLSQLDVISSKYSIVSGYSAALRTNITGISFKSDRPSPDEEPRNCPLIEDEEETRGKQSNRTIGEEVPKKNILPENELLIMPNPGYDEIRLSIINSGELIIFNSLGKPIYQSKVNNESILNLEISDWDSGVYFVMHKSESGKVVARKFLKMD